ncbi:AHH domain-containing protein [Flavobacterium sp.]|uniref:AHH domain-containing protein n=1 Tax=Flavobacterium sp. TaxID=239 RepID=UPI003D6A1B15
MAPVIGEPADLISGVIYTLEGDNLNAALSYASAIPVTGWFTAGTKFGLKLANTVPTVYAVTTKVKLTWKIKNGILTFGQQSQLRKVLGMAISSVDPRQAHHLIPWAKKGHEVVQRAAKYGFHMNESLNGIAVAAWRNQPNHNAYNDLIELKMDLFYQYNPNATPQQCYNFISNLTDNIREWVINHPNSHLNELVL